MAPPDSPKPLSSLASVGVGIAAFVGAIAIVGLMVIGIAWWMPAPKPHPVVEASSPEPLPLFESWPTEPPKLVLAVSGEMLGYLRPCGCSPDQQGGLPRRGGMLQTLQKEKGWTILPVDLGDLIDKSGPLERLRYEYALESLRELGYGSVGIGPKDLALTAQELLGFQMNSASMPITTANLTNDGDMQAIFEEYVPSLVQKEAGGIRVAIASLLGADIQSPDGSTRIADPVEKAKALLEKTKDVDLRVLLAQMSMDEAKKLAEQVPGRDLMVTRSNYEDAHKEDSARVGRTLLVWSGKKGKGVGLVGYWPEREPRMEYEVAPLDKRWPTDPRMDEVYGQFVKRIQTEKFLERVPRSGLLDDNRFVGAESCAKCHTKAYAKWKDSKHAHALETLTKAMPAGQDWNPDCVKCHSTGHGYRTGFETITATPHLGGNQCENCHGPGGRHVDDPKNPQFIQPMVLDVQHVKERCITCHDAENSIHFDFWPYWAKVAHQGTD